MPSCTFCGRANDVTSRFCIDCGKPVDSPRATPGISMLTPPQPMASVPPGPQAPPVVPPTRVPAAGGSARAATAACPHCATPLAGDLPFCSHCGRRTASRIGTGPACPSCGGAVREGVDLFCGRCGTPVGAAPAAALDRSAATTVAIGAVPPEAAPTLALLDDAGEPAHRYTVERGELLVGRSEGDISFPDDVYLSPLHAQFVMREGALWLRDLGSRNGSWTFCEGAFRLSDGDVILVGSQLLRFRRLGYPGPHPAEADATRRLGSLVPNADVAVLQQLRGDGSVRDACHLSPGRHLVLGREQGDWVFPYDQTMSGRHAEVRSEDSEFVVHDLASRNGVALAVRGERKLSRGQRVLLGDQLLRVESV